MTSRFSVGAMLLLLMVPFFWPHQSWGRSPKRDRQLTILLVNDDGYKAAGLVALAEFLDPVAEIFVVGPAEQQSGTGHAITTTRKPLLVHDVTAAGGPPWYSVAALPATCTRLALESLIDRKPDLVISGINAGSNLGLVSFYSGTVGAAREAAMAGYPAIAVSLEGQSLEDYRAGAEIVWDLVKQLQAQGAIEPGLLLNVNLPRGVSQDFKGLKLTRQSVQLTRMDYQRRASPHGQLYYWGNYGGFKRERGNTDVRATQDGYVAVTPLTLDQTAES